MEKYKIEDVYIKDLKIIKSQISNDNRGFFMESYNKKDFRDMGIHDEFVQDNISKSKKYVLRGMHFQLKNPQSKLIRVLKGKIYDVVVDLRKNSKTYKKWFGLELSEENKLMFYIPKGFAHGFLSLEEGTEVLYKTSDYYNPKDEYGIIWNDKELNINWHLKKYNIKEKDLILSEKDEKLKSFTKYLEVLNDINNRS